MTLSPSVVDIISGSSLTGRLKFQIWSGSPLTGRLKFQIRSYASVSSFLFLRGRGIWDMHGARVGRVAGSPAEDHAVDGHLHAGDALTYKNMRITGWARPLSCGRILPVLIGQNYHCSSSTSCTLLAGYGHRRETNLPRRGPWPLGGPLDGAE